jgi:hypothetical protein
MMSRDFFRVSSILHAVKSAAAAASWWRVSHQRCTSRSSETHHIAVLGVRVHKSELVVIDDSSIERPDRPKRININCNNIRPTQRLTVEAPS